MGLFDRFIKRNQQIGRKSIRKRNPYLDWYWEYFLANEAKFRSQRMNVKRSSRDAPITLAYILNELLSIDLSDIGSMTIVSRSENGYNERTETIYETSRVLEYKLYEAVLFYDEVGRIWPKRGENTTLVISYRPGRIINKKNAPDKSKYGTDSSIIIFIRSIDATNDYMRVSVMIPNFSNTDDFRSGAHSENAPFTTSFVLAIDVMPRAISEELLREFDGIKESLLKKDLQRDKLTKDETLILQSMSYTVSRMISDFEYGKKLVQEQRYADALLHLQNAYERLKEDVVVVTNNPRIKDIFNDTCFNIGLCFNEMGQYDRAIYYLDMINGVGKITYTIEYLNAMINNGDPRSMSIVLHYIGEFKDGTRPIDSEEASMFYDFLHRRLAYLFIEYKMWDRARNLLEQLKNSPTCNDFAVSELEYLDNIGK